MSFLHHWKSNNKERKLEDNIMDKSEGQSPPPFQNKPQNDMKDSSLSLGQY